MVLLRGLAAEGKTAGTDRDLRFVREEADVAASDDKAGMIIAEEQTNAGGDFALHITAFDVRAAGAVRAAETGDAGTVPAEADRSATDAGNIFAAEGADAGADITMDRDRD